jgi:hypothetical protein
VVVDAGASPVEVCKILAASLATQGDPGNVFSSALGGLGCHRGTDGALDSISSAPVDGVTKEAQLNHGTASAVSLKTDGSQEADKYVVSSEMSAAGMGSGRKVDTVLQQCPQWSWSPQ